MFQLAVRLTGNSDDAADIAQEAFIRGWNHIKAFRREAMFSTWMHRIVVNVFLDNRKKNRNKKHISLEQSIDASQEATTMDIPDTAAGPEALALESEQQIASMAGVSQTREESRRSCSFACARLFAGFL